MKEFEQVIRIRPQDDAFDDVRMEYAKMLKQQLAKGNNGLVKSKYITFSIEADNIREAKPKLERIESDILNNFKILGVPAYPLNGVERLQILYETFNPDIMTVLIAAAAGLWFWYDSRKRKTVRSRGMRKGGYK